MLSAGPANGRRHRPFGQPGDYLFIGVTNGVTLNVLIQSTPVSLNLELLMQSPPIGSADVNKRGLRYLPHSRRAQLPRRLRGASRAGIAHSPDIRFLQGTDGCLYSGGPLQNEPNSHPAAQQAGRAPVRLEKPSMALVTYMSSGAGPYTFRPSTPPPTTTVNKSCSEWFVNVIRDQEAA
jgi:hypothetical protein